jgi:hypothetical protein
MRLLPVFVHICLPAPLKPCCIPCCHPCSSPCCKPLLLLLLLLLQASLSDVVLLPELLSLPIRTRLGPRILYARKRQVNLLLPSHEAWYPGMSLQQWLEQSKSVPLSFWLTASEQSMCAAVGLTLEDYRM